MKSTKKQIIIVFAILTVALVLSCALVACDKVESDKTGTDKDVCEHVEVTDNAVEPTCTEKGLTEGTHCSKCGKILQAQNEIPALGHDLEHHDGKEATCTEKGWKEYDTCKREGCNHTTYEEIPARGHTGGTATCTEQATCSVCGEKYGDALGHTGGTATCTEQATCSVCGEKYGDALGHNYGDLIPKTEPTCSENGVEAHYKCSVCNKVFKDDEHKTETTLDELTIAINPNAHNFGNWIKNEGADTHTGVCSFNSEHTETESCHGGTATCIEHATCEKCNAKYGELAKHDYQDGVCIVCGIRRPSEGLKYSLNSDGNGYTVTGIGTCTDKELVIPSEYNAKPVTSIGYEAFYNCTGLTSVTIPDSVTSIGVDAFRGCYKLQNIYITDIAAWCNISGLGRLMEYGTSNKKLYINNELATSITIPDGVTKIPDYAFSGCSGLTSTTIPDGVKNIGESAFRYCTGLTSVTIGNSVTSIGERAFLYCRSLTSVTIPDSVTSIGVDAFYGCDNIQDIYITDIGAWCNISGLHNLMRFGASNKNLYINNKLATSITIPNGVKAIPSHAFRGCTGLTNITIPDSVTSIGKDAFYNTLWYNNQPDGLVYAGKVAYKYKGTMPSNTSIVLKEGTLGIAGSAFERCTGLTSVTIPDSVTSIGSSAFDGCTGLTSVTIGKGVTSIDWGAFDGCTGLTNITFNGTKAQWKAISKGGAWNYKVPATQVRCTDGTVSI